MCKKRKKEKYYDYFLMFTRLNEFVHRRPNTPALSDTARLGPKISGYTHHQIDKKDCRNRNWSRAVKQTRTSYMGVAEQAYVLP